MDGKYVDGGDVTGPKTQSYDVTVRSSSSLFRRWGQAHPRWRRGCSRCQPGGVAKVSVDFADVLAKWQEEHPDAAASS
ncbi:MAG: hypothetical protein ACLTQI_03310 [Slackia sp.]